MGASVIRHSRGRRATFLLVVVLTLAWACAHVPKRFPLPKGGVESAEVLGIARARLWGDAPPPWEHDWLAKNKIDMKHDRAGFYLI